MGPWTETKRRGDSLIPRGQEARLTKTVPLIRGSTASNGVNHPQPYLCLTKDKRTHLIYLGEGRKEPARMMSDNYKKMLKIVEGMTLLNMVLLKNDALG